jgi:hypothetical protein
MLTFNYALHYSDTLSVDFTEHIGALLDSKLYFHQQLIYLFPHAVNLVRIIWAITFSFPFLNKCLILHMILIRTNLNTLQLCRFLLPTTNLYGRTCPEKVVSLMLQ